MRTLRELLCMATLCAAIHGTTAAQTLTISANPGMLTIGAATAGSAPQPASDAGTTYTLDGVSGTSRITARLDGPLPTGITLTISLATPAGGTSLGAVPLSTLEQDLVRQIPAGSYSNLGISYQLSATSAAGVVPPETPTVLFTLRSDP